MPIKPPISETNIYLAILLGVVILPILGLILLPHTFSIFSYWLIFSCLLELAVGIWLFLFRKYGKASVTFRQKVQAFLEQNYEIKLSPTEVKRLTSRMGMSRPSAGSISQPGIRLNPLSPGEKKTPPFDSKPVKITFMVRQGNVQEHYTLSCIFHMENTLAVLLAFPGNLPVPTIRAGIPTYYKQGYLPPVDFNALLSRQGRLG